MEFWQQFAPAHRARTPQRSGNDDFFMFGEVYRRRPGVTFALHHRGPAAGHPRLPLPGAARTALRQGGRDHGAARRSSPTTTTTPTPTPTPTALPTFLGNHDMGRIGYFLRRQPGADDAELLQRDQLAHALMFLTRGQPVVYYGDEQGFTGDGGDKDARQDMFASQVAVVQRRRPDRHRRDHGAATTSTPATRSTGRSPRWPSSARPTRRWPTARRSHRYAADGAGVYAFSRIDAERADRVRRRAQQRRPPRRPPPSTRDRRRDVRAVCAGRPATRRAATPRAGSPSPCPPLSRGCAASAGKPGSARRRTHRRCTSRPRPPAAPSADAPRSASRVAGGGFNQVVVRLAAGRRRRLDRRSAPTTTRRTGSSRTSAAWPRGTARSSTAPCCRTARGNLSVASTYADGRRRPPAGARRRRSPAPVDAADRGRPVARQTSNTEMGCAGRLAARLRRRRS